MRALFFALLAACSSTPTVDAPEPRDAPRRDAPLDPGRGLPRELFAYEWACTEDVPPSGVPFDAEPATEDCSTGIWPELPITAVCPTITTGTRIDPDTGMTLPPPDDRTLPTTIAPTESGSFRTGPEPEAWPGTLRVVAWNVEYTRSLDAQIEALTTDPELSSADVFLLSEVDRCSTRNGVRRAARLLAQAIGGDYAYAIEFVELSIGRTIGGDTGQAIVSRRPLSGGSVLCHAGPTDWFTSDEEPRLGRRITLAADVPVGDTTARLYAVHFESEDLFGAERAPQVKEVLDAAQREACGRPIVVAGDFNTWYPTAPERAVMSAADFVDAFELLGDTGGTHSSGRRLDYLYERGFDVLSGTIRRDLDLSDHPPLFATLSLP
jgi:endonuclease/exonuclease/phosphatase family metal-dependent hydrolase